ncbi:MAG: RNA pseudouridine synthase, partial [Clostridia bacterium]
MVEVLFEDNQIIVVKKPQNVLSQGDSTEDKDLLSMIKDYLKEKYNKPGEAFVGLVHRLDRPTGGVMVFAKNSKSAARLSLQIQNGEFKKAYLAVLVGTPRDRVGNLSHYLKKDEKTNTVSIMPQTEEGAKLAELHYEIIAEKNELSLAKIVLKTGRSHQIRVQMASLKTPVFGDAKYGSNSIGNGFNLALWATE